MTAWGSISLAVQGMQAGAFDFVTKPWNNLVLLKSIRTAIELSEQKKEQKMPLNRLDADNKFHFDKIIGQAAPLMDVLGTVSGCSDQRFSPDNRREWNGQRTDCRGDSYEQFTCEGAVRKGQPWRTFVKPFSRVRCSGIRKERLPMLISIVPDVSRWQIKGRSFSMKSAISNCLVR